MLTQGRGDRDGNQEFWDEVRREAEAGETVILGTALSIEEAERSSGLPGSSGSTAWIAIVTKLPPNACPVLAWDADEEVPGCLIASYYFLTGKWVSAESAALRITHWQPLPLPPV